MQEQNTTKSREYIVYRHGSNAANQPMELRPCMVALLTAGTREQAEAMAATLPWSVGGCYNNQFLRVVARGNRNVPTDLPWYGVGEYSIVRAGHAG